MIKSKAMFVSASLSLALLSAAMAVPGCATFAQNLAMADTALTVASGVVDSIEAGEQVYFTQHPNADAQAKITKGIADTRAAIVTTAQALQAAEDLNRQNVPALFADLENSYGDLLALVKQIGIVQATAGAKFGAAPGGALVVPAPADLVPRVR